MEQTVQKCCYCSRLHSDNPQRLQLVRVVRRPEWGGAIERLCIAGTREEVSEILSQMASIKSFDFVDDPTANIPPQPASDDRIRGDRVYLSPGDIQPTQPVYFEETDGSVYEVNPRNAGKQIGGCPETYFVRRKDMPVRTDDASA